MVDLHPLVVDQQFMTAIEPGDHGCSRWERVVGMLEAEPPEQLRNHIQDLIDQSPETPEMEGKQS